MKNGKKSKGQVASILPARKEELRAYADILPEF
jgi:hypothetical protein